MITEDYCSYEVAKLLKEKGFDEKTLSYYEDNVLCHGDWFEWNRSPLGHIAAPTHQMAMAWLREMHNYYIQVMLDSWACGGHSGYYVVIQKIDSDFEMMLQDAVNEVFYQTYEEAVEAALKYVLENLI